MADQISCHVTFKGRGIYQQYYHESKCICLREKGLIICHVCGYTCKGRVRTNCQVHPQTIFLIDISSCPRCRAYWYLLSEEQVEMYKTALYKSK